MIDWLSGKKTYIGLAASFILALLLATHVISLGDEAVQIIAAAILAFTGVSYRAAISKT